MKGFESFDINAWADNGVTIQPKPRVAHEQAGSAWARKSAKYFVNAIFVAAIWSTVSLPDSVAVNSVMIPENITGIAGARAGVIEYAPEGYWQALVADMKGWTPLEESDSDLPDPLV